MIHHPCLHNPSHLPAPTAQLDRDGDGVVSIDELHEVLDDCNIDISRDQLQELLTVEGGLGEGQHVTPEVFKVPWVDTMLLLLLFLL